MFECLTYKFNHVCYEIIVILQSKITKKIKIMYFLLLTLDQNSKRNKPLKVKTK